MDRKDRVSLGIENAFRERGIPFNWGSDLKSLLGSNRRSRRFVEKIVSKYDATPLDAPLRTKSDEIPPKIETPLDLLAYVVDNRRYTKRMILDEQKSSYDSTLH